MGNIVTVQASEDIAPPMQYQINENSAQNELKQELSKIIGSSKSLSSLQQKLIAELIFELSFNRYSQFAWNMLGWGEISTAGPDGGIKQEGYDWFKSVKKSKKNLIVKDWNYFLSYTKLSGDYIDNHSEKTVIIQHGYRGPVTGMAAQAKMFYEMGYNVLMPHARGTGRSEGLYINFGWREKDDIRSWINTIPSEQEIILMGESMGAATMMMVSGEKLPSNVKAIIEDCGYASLEQELENVFDTLNNLSDTPLPKSILNYVYKDVQNKLKFNVSDASALNQVKNSTLPMLFIHGNQDILVNPEFVYDLYEAKEIGYKDLMVVEGANHVQSISYGYEQYKDKVTNFLEKVK
jgi:Prolyl oligopeptidase family.